MQVLTILYIYCLGQQLYHVIRWTRQVVWLPEFHLSLCIYGGQDTYSGKIMFLRIWTTSGGPRVIGRFYLEYLFTSQGRQKFVVNIYVDFRV